MTVDIELDKEDDRILETIDNGITKVGLNAENMKDLEQKEKEYIQELRDADKIFGDDRNAKEIELLDSIENDQEWSNGKPDADDIQEENVFADDQAETIHSKCTAQSSLSNFTQKYLCKCKDTYFILQDKSICIYEDSFRAKILRDDCALKIPNNWNWTNFLKRMSKSMMEMSNRMNMKRFNQHWKKLKRTRIKSYLFKIKSKRIGMRRTKRMISKQNSLQKLVLTIMSFTKLLIME